MRIPPQAENTTNNNYCTFIQQKLNYGSMSTSGRKMERTDASLGRKVDVSTVIQKKSHNLAVSVTTCEV